MSKSEDTQWDNIAAKVQRSTKPTSFLRPTDAYGDTFMPSYTKYQNSPGNSYTHPLYGVFHDRRQGGAAPSAPKQSSYLAPQSKTPGMGTM